MKGTQTCKILMLIPSLRISGGNKEALRLAQDLQSQGMEVEVLTFWKAAHEVSCPGLKMERLSNFPISRFWAAMQYPVLLCRFLLYMSAKRRSRGTSKIALLLTHFSTFPFAWLAPQEEWCCFIQGTEWNFLPEGIGRTLLRELIVSTSKRSRVIAANSYLETGFVGQGVHVLGQLGLWPGGEWQSAGQPGARDVDVVMVLRSGHAKRPELYIDFLGRCKARGLSTAVITPDEDLHRIAMEWSENCLLRPNQEEMKVTYERSRLFLLLSETEGFGLPPLEAMGSGCIPICRDSGGPRSYMCGGLKENLVPLGASMDEIEQRVVRLLSSARELEALSAEARQTFLDGLNENARIRKACIERLAFELTS